MTQQGGLLIATEQYLAGYFNRYMSENMVNLLERRFGIKRQRKPNCAGLRAGSPRAFTADVPIPEARRSCPTRARDEITNARKLEFRHDLEGGSS